MNNFRIIPVILLDGNDVVKGKRFKDRIYVGDPINTVRIFNDKCVDELCLFDINANKPSNSLNINLLQEIASQAFMPLSYGGGLKTIEDVESIFKIGFEKCIINSFNYSDMSLIKKASNKFGSQSISCSIDYRRSTFSKKPILYSMSGIKKQKNIILDFCLELQRNGAGEIILNSIDKEGTREGLDIEIYKDIRDSLTIPLVASGGTKSLDDIANLRNQVNISAVAVGDLFTFYGKRKSVLINYPEYNTLKKVLK